MNVISRPASFFDSLETLSVISDLCASEILQSLSEKGGEDGINPLPSLFSAQICQPPFRGLVHIWQAV